MKIICKKKQAAFEITLKIINGKWKMRIIYELACEGILRYGLSRKILWGLLIKC